MAFKPFTKKSDDAADKKAGIKEGSSKDKALDKKRGVPEDDKPFRRGGRVSNLKKRK